MPVPSRSVGAATAAAASATSGSCERQYSSGSSPLAAPGYGVVRLVGMWVCSGSHSEAKPRSSVARASSTTSIDLSVANIVTP
jgi:hypothetical protein